MLKLQYFGHLIQRANLLEKTQMLGKIEGRRRRGWQRIRWLNGITDSLDLNLSKLQEIARTGKPGMLQSMGLQRVKHNSATKQQHSNLLGNSHLRLGMVLKLWSEDLQGLLLELFKVFLFNHTVMWDWILFMYFNQNNILCPREWEANMMKTQVSSINFRH